MHTFVSRFTSRLDSSPAYATAERYLSACAQDPRQRGEGAGGMVIGVSILAVVLGFVAFGGKTATDKVVGLATANAISNIMQGLHSAAQSGFGTANIAPTISTLGLTPFGFTASATTLTSILGNVTITPTGSTNQISLAVSGLSDAACAKIVAGLSGFASLTINSNTALTATPGPVLAGTQCNAGGTLDTLTIVQ